MITAFFLATRALINFACFLASFSNSPGWRPTYRMYNKWVSLVTAILCLAVMFAISWWQALITCGLGAALFAYIRRSAPPVNWGAAEIGLKWLNAKKSLLQLNRVKLIHHVKTWRPILLLVPLKFRRDTDMLVRYARQLDAGNGFAILGDIMVGDFMSMASKYVSSLSPILALRSALRAKVLSSSVTIQGADILVPFNLNGHGTPISL